MLSYKKIVRFKVVGGELPNAGQVAPKLSPLGVVSIIIIKYNIYRIQRRQPRIFRKRPVIGKESK